MGDSVDHDIRILLESNWRNSALNREEAFGEGQGSCRVVEPIMMIMMIMMTTDPVCCKHRER
jgi:hypothetical protein